MEQDRQADPIQRLAAALYQAWQESDLRLSDVAARTRYHPSYLSRAFHGRQTLSLSALTSVAAALDRDHRALLADAGLNEEDYRSRFVPRPSSHAAGLLGEDTPRGMLIDELQAIRQLKREGRPDEARGAIGALERLMTQHLGGLPRDRDALFIWAALLMERARIVQDIALPATVLRGARDDLAALTAIGAEHESNALLAFARLIAADVYLKDGQYTEAIDHFAWAATHAPAASMRGRCCAGWALALSRRNQPGDAALARGLCAQVRDLFDGEVPDETERALWDNEGWLLARLWCEKTLALTFLVLGDRSDTAPPLAHAVRHYDEAIAAGSEQLDFAISLAHCRLEAACLGALDMSAADALALGLAAYRLADAGNSHRSKAQIQALLADNLGVILPPPGRWS